MNKKGFTLIELLAVIIVIGIVAVITVPIVKDSIDNAKEKTLKKQTSSIIESAKSWVLKNTDKLLENDTPILIKVETLKQEGYLENKIITDPVDKVEMNGCVSVKYNVNYNQYEYDYKSDCIAGANTIFTKATGEASVPACITNNTACTAGTKVGVKVNNSQTYDFYVMSEDASKGTITLIMNQNIGETVAWISKDDYVSAGGGESDYTNLYSEKGPITALNYLESQTSSWTNIPLETYTLTDDNSTPKYTSMTRTARARMITKTEAIGLGCQFTSDSGGLVAICPTWLHEGDTYWTSSIFEEQDSCAWMLSSILEFNSLPIDNTAGVRPVITISKTAPVY